MSRTYHKNVRLNICQGNNTPYYKMLRRKYRHNVNLAVKMIFHVDDETFENNATYKNIPKVRKNTWMEPTDGYMLLTFEDTKQTTNNKRYNNIVSKILKYRYRKKLHYNMIYKTH